MSKKKPRKNKAFAFRSLAFRLTVWYAGIFLVITVLLFIVLYFLQSSLILRQTDQELKEKAHSIDTMIKNQGKYSLQEQDFLESRAASEKATFFRLVDHENVELATTTFVNPDELSFTKADIARLMSNSEKAYFQTVKLSNFAYPVRVGYFALNPNADGTTPETTTVLEVGQSLENSKQLLDLFRVIFLAGLTGAFILTVLLSGFLAGNLLKMINNVTQTAAEIADAAHPQLDRRVYVGNDNNEISEMARTFNTMLSRIQELVTGMEEMSDNMSHDLKSPVTRIRGLAEITLMHEASVDEYQKMAADIINECDTLLSMINNILFISKAKHGVYVPQMSQIDLNIMVEQAYQMFLPLAESKELFLNRAVYPKPLRILADKKLLQRALANLIDNAIKYTNAGGVIDVECTREGRRAVLRVSDNGTGIPTEDLERIFERFYRSDVSRSSEGTGLGLSFVKAAIEAMGGHIHAESKMGQSSSFIAVFDVYEEEEDILTSLMHKIQN